MENAQSSPKYKTDETKQKNDKIESAYTPWSKKWTEIERVIFKHIYRHIKQWICIKVVTKILSHFISISLHCLLLNYEIVWRSI